MKKVTDQREELESVAGGVDNRCLYTCPACGVPYDVHLLDIQATSSGCFPEEKFTCPGCGYSWVM